MYSTVIIDNYDSFTYNLVHLVSEVTEDQNISVMKNDNVDYNVLDQSHNIILSPGPGVPDEAGDLKKIISKYHQSKKILGVCLGHQAIGESFGASLINLNRVFHGKKTKMIQTATPSPIFESIPSEIFVGRYHSWVINKKNDTSQFNIIGIDELGTIMAIQHKTFKLFGLQFHPESIMTEYGKQMIYNFIYNI